jgi:hypothetical protein
MTLILNNEEVEKVLTMDDCLDVLRTRLKTRTRMRSIRSGSHLCFDGTVGHFYRLKTMNGAVPRCGVMALRIASDVVHFLRLRGWFARKR